MLGRALFRLQTLLRGNRPHSELDEELQAHLDRDIERLVAAGVAPTEAREQARRAFGNLTSIHESAIESAHFEVMDKLARNARLAARSLGRRPTFTITAVLSLALGLGAATVVFSVTNSLLLRPLPYRNPAALVSIWPRQIVANREIQRLRAATHSYANVASFSPGWLVSLTDVPVPRQLNSARVSGNFFSMLGVKPLLGREFTMDAETPGHDRLALLSEELWSTSFNRDPAIVGRSITLSGTDMLVVGVMPRSFQLLDPGADLWTPMPMDPNEMAWTGGTVLALGELRQGITVAIAEAELRQLVPQLAKDFTHPANWGENVTVAPLQSTVTGGLTSTLTLLLVAVLFLLLIAVTNVANLLLVRIAEREQEMGVRVSLGATASQLQGMLLVEGMTLSLAGGVLGIGICYAGVALLRHWLPATTPRLGELSVDTTVLMAGFVAVLIIGLLFAVIPARVARRGDLASTLRRGRGQTARDSGVRGALVAVEFGIALLLSTGAILMGRTVLALYHVDRGMDTRHLLVMQMQPDFPGDAERRVYWHEVLARVGAVAGVQSATTMLHLPMGGRSWHADVIVENRPAADGAAPPRTAWQSVSANYFQVTGVPVLRGRGFTTADDAAAPLAIAVNAAFASAIFPGEDPLGRRIQAGNATNRQWATIIGVVGDMRHDSLNVAPAPEVYVSMDQRMVGATSLVVRTRTTDVLRMSAAVREAAASVNQNTPISNIRALDDLYAGSLQRPRLILVLLALFAGAGTLLSAIGIYGVVAYGVRQRTREIGIRAALGADAGALQWVFVREAIRHVAGGFALGIPLALIAARFVRAMLFGVQPFDPLSFGSVAVFLILVAVIASWLPARRATRVDPAGVLNES